jgi:hypothetical protein
LDAGEAVVEVAVALSAAGYALAVDEICTVSVWLGSGTGMVAVAEGEVEFAGVRVGWVTCEYTATEAARHKISASAKKGRKEAGVFVPIKFSR